MSRQVANRDTVVGEVTVFLAKRTPIRAKTVATSTLGVVRDLGYAANPKDCQKEWLVLAGVCDSQRGEPQVTSVPPRQLG